MCKTVSQITYTVLVETLNTAQSINQSVVLRVYWLTDYPPVHHRILMKPARPVRGLWAGSAR